ALGGACCVGRAGGNSERAHSAALNTGTVCGRVRVRIVVAHSHLNALGGGERVTLELLRGLSQRHDVELWAGAFDPKRTFAGLTDFTRRDLRSQDWLVRRPSADAVIANTFG